MREYDLAFRMEAPFCINRSRPPYKSKLDFVLLEFLGLDGVAPGVRFRHSAHKRPFNVAPLSSGTGMRSFEQSSGASKKAASWQAPRPWQNRSRLRFPYFYSRHRCPYNQLVGQ